jgi:hypothetical protein
MAKMKKMADGGSMATLGTMVQPPDIPGTQPTGGGLADQMPSIGGGGVGDSAMGGLDTINRGASSIGSALSRASEAIGSGGGGSAQAYKKGGKVTTTRRMSTGSTSKKSSCW